MKCVNCGAEIALTDKVCAYCGSRNLKTADLQADMEKQENRTKKAQRKLVVSISRNMPLVINMIILIALVVGVSVVFYIKDNAYHFQSDAKQNESIQKSEEYRAEIRQYLDDGDYMGFLAFMDYHNIAEYREPYEDLGLVAHMADYYGDLLSDVESFRVHGEDAGWYSPENDVFNCRMSINDFYHEFGYKASEIDADLYRDYIYDMREKADIILKIYLGMDDAKREEFLADSINGQEAYLEELIDD
ncbi:MAG: zinc ribbon domain-containing protein [Lachnospiraceae bacterium]|nr:zinc ribbon domain-containing protein [Lachnospiraceae bacterium]